MREGTKRPALAAFADQAGKFSAMVSGLGLLTIAGIICWEVFARYVLNEPTTWVTEIATYLLVAVSFLGLAAAQRARAHIYVELVVDRLSEKRQQDLLAFANWIALFFVVFSCWQTGIFVYGEYVNGTRDWGLLSTPQWIPETPILIGFVLFGFSLLGENLGIRAERTAARSWLVVLLIVGLVVGLLLCGRQLVMIQGTRLDWGTILVCLVTILLIGVISGVRMSVAVTATIGGLALLFWFARTAPILAIGGLLSLAILGLMLAGVRIAIALGVVGIIGLYVLLPKPQLLTIAERAWSSVNSFTLTAVPMFVLMSTLLMQSGVTGRMFDSLVRWFGRTPGGLAHASVGASAIFAAVSGSSVATAATLGRVACPDMIKRGYSPKLTFGVTAAGATLGIMIPPSIPMVIYGSAVGAPVNVLFIAGIVPGLLLAVMFMVTAYIWSKSIPGSAPPGRAYTYQEKFASIGNIVPFITVISAVLGSLYAGIATPTEAGALGAAMAAVLCVLYRRFTWKMLYETAVETASVTAFIMLIVVGAAILSWVFDYLKVPRTLVESIKEANVSPWIVIALISLIYIVLGMFVESISMILMTLPVTYPVVMALGLDPIWFGIYLVTMVEVGLITPPVGMVLFVLRGVSGNVSLKEISAGALPFVGIILIFVAIMFIFPELIAWLPSKVQ